MSCQNTNKCTKGPSGPNGRSCQKKEHTKCDLMQCTNIATNGPNNSRIYCSICVTQLKIKETHPCNSKHCILCGKQNKAKYGDRTAEGAVRSSHCSDCAKPLGYVLAGVILCSFAFEDGTLCPTQAKGSTTEGETTRAFCGSHLIGKDFDRKNTCNEDGCDFSQVMGSYCTAHGKARGIVRNDTCVDCANTRGTYKDGQDLLCQYCKNEREKINPDLNILSINAMCEICMVVRRSFAPVANDQPLRCANCCDGLGWVSVTNKKCILCHFTCVNRAYGFDYCTRCYFYQHPGDPQIRNYKTKEQTFMMPLKDIYPNIILDKRIAGGCSQRRPDGFIECLTHSVVVEIDEDQHIGYNEICENRRMIEIYLDVANRPIIFIRLNPDKYKRNGIEIKSTFWKTKTGELRCDKYEFEHRFKILKDTVEEAVDRIPTKLITVIHLCFTSK